MDTAAVAAFLLTCVMKEAGVVVTPAVYVWNPELLGILIWYKLAQ